jgi:hypothetical protein
LHTEIEGVQRAVRRAQRPTDFRDAFDCARGKLIAGIIAPLKPSLRRRAARMPAATSPPHDRTAEPVQPGTWLVGHGCPEWRRALPALIDEPYVAVESSHAH